MRDTSKLIEQIKAGQLDSRLKDVYVDNLLLAYQRERYTEIPLFKGDGRKYIEDLVMVGE